MYWDALTASGIFVSVLLSLAMMYLSRLARE
jgi:hypothetical protein